MKRNSCFATHWPYNSIQTLILANISDCIQLMRYLWYIIILISNTKFCAVSYQSKYSKENPCHILVTFHQVDSYNSEQNSQTFLLSPEYLLLISLANLRSFWNKNCKPESIRTYSNSWKWKYASFYQIEYFAFFQKSPAIKYLVLTHT